MLVCPHWNPVCAQSTDFKARAETTKLMYTMDWSSWKMDPFKFGNFEIVCATWRTYAFYSFRIDCAFTQWQIAPRKLREFYWEGVARAPIQTSSFPMQFDILSKLTEMKSYNSPDKVLDREFEWESQMVIPCYRSISSHQIRLRKSVAIESLISSGEHWIGNYCKLNGIALFNGVDLALFCTITDSSDC